MTFRELLKSQGVADDSISNIEAAMKENHIYLSNNENIDIRYKQLKEKNDEANSLITTLKKEISDNSEAVKKVTEYETKITELNNQLDATTRENAIKVALLGAKAKDVDYLLYKLRNDKDLKLKDDGTIEGLDKKIEALKSEHPTQFEEVKSKPIVKPNPLNKPDENNNNNSMTREKLDKLSYYERVKFKTENPDEYNTLMGRGEEE